MRICLIGVTHPCHNPRLTREADTLAAAGHEVRVVAPCFVTDLAQKDQRHIAYRNWRLDTVDYRPSDLPRRYRSFIVRGRRRLFESLFNWFPTGTRAALGYIPAVTELTEVASSKPADWYIAHSHGALPVAVAAARRWNARIGFDCEDLLAEHDSKRAQMLHSLEQEFIGQCDYVSVSSACIGKELMKSYAIAEPHVLYNTFPLSLASGMVEPQDRPPSSILRLHWFGQTIGPDRGIEDAIEAAGIMGKAVEVHLRGNCSHSFATQILNLANRFDATVRIHEQVDHDQLIRTMAGFDVGLALERPEHGNYSKTLTNKIGSYMLAGLAIAATDTPGQREFLDETPTSGFLYQAGKPNLLANALEVWMRDSNKLRAAQQAAWDAARQRFCWDIEEKNFIQLLEHTPHRDLRRTA